jgi:hypothetical protein
MKNQLGQEGFDEPDLLEYFTLERERIHANHTLGKMKARFKRIACRTLVVVVFFVIINWAIETTNRNIADALIFAIGFSILLNTTIIRDVMSNWSDMLTAKKTLRSWDLLISNYKKNKFGGDNN